MAKKRRVKRGLPRKVDALVEFLIYESTGGTIGHVPELAKNDDGTLKENKVPFSVRAKFADSVMKYVNGQVPSEGDDEEKSGLDEFKERLNGSGEDERGADAGAV